MRRLSRRLWTFSVSAVAAVIVVAAVCVGTFRILVAVAPGYRQQLEQRISRAAGRPVRIGHMDLVWAHWEPTLDFANVTVMRAHGSRPMLHLRRVRVGLPLTRLVRGRVSPDRLTLVGPRLGVHRGADGQLRLAGLAQGSAGGATSTDWRALLARVETFSHVAVRDARMRWRTGQAGYTLKDLDLTMNHAAGVRHLQVSAALPPALGGRMQASAVARGPLTQPQKLQVQATGDLTGVRPEPWLQPLLRAGVQVHGAARTVELSANWRDGHVEQATAQIAGGALTASAADGRRWTLLQSMDFNLRWAPAGKGWAVVVSRPGSVSLPLNGALTRYGGGAGGAVWQLSLARLPLKAVSPWLHAFAAIPPWARALKPSGRLRAVQASVQARAGSGPALTFRARFRDAGFNPAGSVPGLRGLSGEISADNDGGELRLDRGSGEIDAPHVFAQPLPLTTIGARVRWQRAQGGGWRVDAQRLRLDALGAEANAHMTLRLPAGKAPSLDLSADFAARSVRRLRGHIPQHLPPKLRRWLARALSGGRIRDGHLSLRGPVTALPFPGAAGQLLATFQAQSMDLDYGRGWPPVKDLNAKVSFRGRSLHVQASSGQIAGVAIGPATASIADFRQNVLKVSGQAHGDLKREFAFLRESPLHKRFQALLRRLSPSGPAAVTVDLTVPLRDPHHTRVKGQVQLQGGHLAIAHWPHPLDDIRGRFSFRNGSVSAHGVKARMLGLPLTLSLTPARNGKGQLSTRVQALARLTLPADADHLKGLVPAFVLSHLQGQTPLHAELTVGGDLGPSPVRIDSDLKGMAITLPPPLAKPAKRAQALAVRVVPRPDHRVDIHIDATQLLTAALRVRTGEGRGHFVRGRLRLGGGHAILPQRPGLWIAGHVRRVDAVPWLKLVRAQAQAAAAGKQPAGWLGGADLNIDEVTGYGQRWRAVHATLARANTAWRLRLNSPDAEGSVRWPMTAAAGRRRVFDADFKRLQLRLPALAGRGKRPSQPVDPGQWPGLRLICRDCKLGKLDLGDVTGELKPVSNGLKLTSLSLHGQDFQGQASGQWTRPRGKSQATLHAQLTTRHLGRILKDLGYAQSLTAKRTHLDADVAWQPRAAGLGVANLTGTLAMQANDGTVPAVDPGASRVLGLFNFYALPRRLSLNFRDVVGSGLAFDTIHGTFRFKNGNATTQGVELKNPSMHMVMKGRIGLMAQDYDEEVTIRPQVGASLSIASIAGAVVGGPAVGALVFLAQQLLNKPLDQASTIRYHLGGTWSDPKITKR